MAEISGLSVKVSAATAAFTAGMDRVQDTATDAALSLRRLGAASESADRDVEALGRSAIGASGGILTFGASTEGAGFAVRGLSGSIVVALIPALVALTAALAPVVGALAGLAAVGAAIGGVGLVGAIGAIATNTEQLKTEFMDMVSVLRSEFAPVFETATAVLSIFINEFQAIIPELVPAQSVIEELGGAFADLGSVLISALPAFVDLAVTLTQEFLPPFTQWLEDILPEIPGMVQGLVDIMDRMIPRFQEAGATLMEILPPFTEFGFTVLEVLGPALAAMAEAGTDALEFINGLSESTQKAVAAASVLAPVVSLLASLFGGALLSGVGAVVTTAIAPLLTGLSTVGSVMTTIGASVLFLSNLFGMALGAIVPFTGAISSLIIGIISVGSTISALLSPIFALVSVLGPVGLLGAAVVGIIGLFVMFEDEIRNIISQVVPFISETVNRALNWLQTNGPPLVFKAMKKLGSVFRAGLTEIYNMIAKPGESVIFGAIGDLASWLTSNAPGLLSKAWSTLVDLSVAAWEGFRAGLFGEGSTGIIPQAINDVIDWLLNTATSLFADAAGTVGAALLTPFELAFNTLFNLAAEAFTSIVRVINKGLDVLPDQITSRIGFDQLEVPGLEARETDVGDVFSNRRANIQNRIEVVIEGELPEESIKEVSANRVEAVNRDTRRNQGRGTRL